MSSKNLVLRTMYIDPDVDDKLRTEAFDSRTSKNDLLRRYLRLGMEAAKKQNPLNVDVKVISSKKDALVVVKKSVLNKRPTSKAVAGVKSKGKSASSQQAMSAQSGK